MTKEKMTLATMVELHNQLVSSHNELVEEVKELRAKVEELENRKQSPGVRNRGPLSTREMKDEDAERIMLGDLKDESHTKCAEVLGLSYGQVYSARNGYTFKGVYARSKK